MSCRAISAPAPPPLLHSPWDLQSCFSCFQSSLQLQFPFFLCFFSPLKYIIPEVLPQSLMGSALSCSGTILEPAGIDSVGCRGRFQQLLTEPTPVPPLQQNLAMQSQYKHLAQQKWPILPVVLLTFIKRTHGNERKQVNKLSKSHSCH